jgi:hypothetical protein
MVNRETLSLMLKFGGAMLALLLLVWGIALLTPKLAKLIDRLLGLKPKQTQLEAENFRVKDLWMGNLNTEDRSEMTEDRVTLDPELSPEQTPAEDLLDLNPEDRKQNTEDRVPDETQIAGAEVNQEHKE